MQQRGVAGRGVVQVAFELVVCRAVAVDGDDVVVHGDACQRCWAGFVDAADEVAPALLFPADAGAALVAAVFGGVAAQFAGAGGWLHVDGEAEVGGDFFQRQCFGAVVQAVQEAAQCGFEVFGQEVGGEAEEAFFVKSRAVLVVVVPEAVHEHLQADAVFAVCA